MNIAIKNSNNNNNNNILFLKKGKKISGLYQRHTLFQTGFKPATFEFPTYLPT